MVSPPRTVVGVVALLAFLAVALSQRPDAAEPTARAQAGPAPQVIGMAGCAATGCHGRTEGTAAPTDLWHESFSRWIDRDPHTRAYAVLESKLGRDIMARLRQGDPTVPESATKDARCLACHANPSLAAPTAMADERLNRLRSEGVSCEACHGAAERWQIAHTNWTNPATRTADFHAHDMIDLNDWSTQAKTCVGCHVGAPADATRGYPVRDMNHDMIAAGHPRLEFEFVTFHQKLSKHWNPRHRGTPESDSGKHPLLTAWLLGQIVTEQAYCELSLDRIARGQKGEPRSPLPEFADWNCSSCHHRLAPSPLRADAAKAAPKKLGTPEWIGTSTEILPTPLARFGGPLSVQASVFRVRWNELESIRKDIAASPRERAGKKVEVLLNPGMPLTPLNWEESVRTYLALRSLDRVLPTPSKESGARLTEYRSALWGSANEPPRRETAEKGYQRKPESRWEWEKPGREWKPVEEIVKGLRKDLASRLQHLQP